jgi:hypothetical protein
LIGRPGVFEDLGAMTGRTPGRVACPLGRPAQIDDDGEIDGRDPGQIPFGRLGVVTRPKE